MTAEERRDFILNRLQEQGSIQIAEISETLQVSKMTIHRDLVLLEQLGHLRRIHGGAVPSAGAPSKDGEARTLPSSKSGECLICTRPPTQHLLYALTTRSGEQRQACCPHCGVSAHLFYGDQIVMALTADYLSGKLHAAQNSHFLCGSEAAPCCRPSILTFEDEEMARRFQRGFGGVLGTLNDAIHYLREEMTLDPERDGCPHCAAARKA